MDECNLSFKFPAVPRQTSTEWLDCRRHGQERKADKHVTSRPHILNKAMRYLDQKSWKPQIVAYVHHKWHTDTIYETDVAQEMGLQVDQTVSCVVVHFGDVPAERISRVVGHDQTRLCERPSEVTLNAPAIQDFRALGARRLDQGQQQRLVLIRTKKSLQKRCLSIKKKVRK